MPGGTIENPHIPGLYRVPMSVRPVVIQRTFQPPSPDRDHLVQTTLLVVLRMSLQTGKRPQTESFER
jgi:hypothetical protein